MLPGNAVSVLQVTYVRKRTVVRQSRVITVAPADHYLLENSIVSVWKATRVPRVTVTSMNARLVMRSVSMELPVSTPSAVTG